MTQSPGSPPSESVTPPERPQTSEDAGTRPLSNSPGTRAQVPERSSREHSTSEERPQASEDVDARSRSSRAKFSDQALILIRTRRVQYFEDLVSTSALIARRKGADVISANDVEAADKALLSQPRRILWTALNTTGGVLAGAGLSQTFAALSASDRPSTLAWLIGIVPLLVGSIMLTISMRRS